MLHGKRWSVELIGRGRACLADGRGIRATARVCEGDANTVWQWLVEAAEPLQAFTSSCRWDVQVHQRPLDELAAVIRRLKAGASSEDAASQRLEPARPWVWTAIDPVSPWLLAMEVGPRTVERAQRVVHQVGSG